MKEQQHTAYLSIGSNVGKKKKNLDAAVALLNQRPDMSVVSVSNFYRTQPQDYTQQDWFVNAVLKIETTLEPGALLDTLKQTEFDLDEEGKPFRFGPRIIDLDIIYYDDLILKTDRLEIPHPRMHERCFVLVPLCDIGAETIHPELKKSTVELLDNIEKQETQEVILLDEED